MEMITFGNVLTLVITTLGFAFGYGALSQRVRSLENQIMAIVQLRDTLTAIQLQLAQSNSVERPVANCRNYFDHQLEELKKTVSVAVELSVIKCLEKQNV